LTFQIVRAEEPRTVISLNGIWEFDQTTNAFPPEKFTRKIPVPGLIHLAEPRIEEYDKFFKRPGKAESVEQFNLYNLDYTPRYSWYRKTVFIPKELNNKEGMITIKKSQYVSQVYINGMDMGTSIACYTPIEFPVNKAVKFGAENEILIKVGERIWLPAEAAGGTDKEKEHYLPGIWDDVLLSFTGNIRINRLLVLPSVENKKLIIKTQVRSLIPAQIFYGDPMNDSVRVEVSIAEKISGKKVASVQGKIPAKRDNLNEMVLELPFNQFTSWTPEKPFLYIATARLITKNGVSDEMDEPHPYMGRVSKSNMEPLKEFYSLGDLDFKPQSLKMIQMASAPQLANEYGWIWLWRNGMPSKLTVNEYNYYLGPDSGPEQNREFQAYYMQLETEWLRSEPELAGVLAFCYLANNYGYTGDWFMENIKDLKPIPTLNWFRHAFAPTAVFVNLPDERYVKLTDPHQPGEKLSVKLAKINDLNKDVSGKVTLRILDSYGKTVSKTGMAVAFSAFECTSDLAGISLPKKPGGYLLIAEFIANGSTNPVISRRYIKVGKVPEYIFFEIKTSSLK
jgi:hypothetical protein